MACTQPYWSALQVGSQHLARQFADHGWKVHYFSSPITLFHLIKFRSYETRKRLRHSLQLPSMHYGDMITSYIPFSAISPLALPPFRTRFTIEKWHKTILKPIKTELFNNKAKVFDLLYIDNIFYHFLLSSLNYSKSIFRIMDIHTEFRGWNANVKTIAKRIARQSDTIIYSAKGLEDYVKCLTPDKSFLIPNGVDFTFFRNALKFKNEKKHSSLKNIPNPIILYVGMIDARVDFKLIKNAAQKHPEISFVFAGPCGEGIRPRNLLRNIFFIGSVPHNETPLLMSSARAGIIPFDTKNHMERIKSIRPLKLFEYFAAGIPVISARWPELELINSPAWIYDTEESFVKFVKKAIRESHEPKPFYIFSEKHGWKNKFNLLMRKLESCGSSS